MRLFPRKRRAEIQTLDTRIGGGAGIHSTCTSAITNETGTASTHRQQGLSERPFFINPLLFAAKPSLFAHPPHVRGVVFVRAFCPDRLIRLNLNREFSSPDRYRLPCGGAKMYFNPLCSLIVKGDMPKSRQLEIGIQ